MLKISLKWTRRPVDGRRFEATLHGYVFEIFPLAAGTGISSPTYQAVYREEGTSENFVIEQESPSAEAAKSAVAAWLQSRMPDLRPQGFSALTAACSGLGDAPYVTTSLRLCSESSSS